MKKDLCIVLVSGGLDSCVVAAIAQQEYKLAFLHVNYGQRTEKRELRAFNDIATFFNVEKKLVVDISYLKEIGGSSLINKKAPVERNRLSTIDNIPSTYVPFRNTHFLAIATSWAEVIGATSIFMGAVEQDSSGYPDCRLSYFETFNQLIAKGTKPQTRITVVTPVINLSKKDIILKGLELKVPFHLTWSCYTLSKKACGECESCILRLKGFREAGIEDPLKYRKKSTTSLQS